MNKYMLMLALMVQVPEDSQGKVNGALREYTELVAKRVDLVHERTKLLETKINLMERDFERRLEAIEKRKK